MMGHLIDEIRVLLKGHNDPSNMTDLRGVGETLMRHHRNGIDVGGSGQKKDP